MGNHTPDLAAEPGSTLFIHDVNEAPACWWLGIQRTVLVEGSDTSGRHWLTQEILPEGAGPPPHEHAWSDEHFLMLDGEITFVIGHQIRVARKGDLVFVPRGVCHAFRVDSLTAVFINGHTPAKP